VRRESDPLTHASSLGDHARPGEVRPRSRRHDCGADAGGPSSDRPMTALPVRGRYPNDRNYPKLRPICISVKYTVVSGSRALPLRAGSAAS